MYMGKILFLRRRKWTEKVRVFYCVSQKTCEHFDLILTGQLCAHQSEATWNCNKSKQTVCLGQSWNQASIKFCTKNVFVCFLWSYFNATFIYLLCFQVILISISMILRGLLIAQKLKQQTESKWCENSHSNLHI